MGKARSPNVSGLSHERATTLSSRRRYESVSVLKSTGHAEAFPMSVGRKGFATDAEISRTESSIRGQLALPGIILVCLS